MIRLSISDKKNLMFLSLLISFSFKFLLQASNQIDGLTRVFSVEIFYVKWLFIVYNRITSNIPYLSIIYNNLMELSSFPLTNIAVEKFWMLKLWMVVWYPQVVCMWKRWVTRLMNATLWMPLFTSVINAGFSFSLLLMYFWCIINNTYLNFNA